MAQLFKMAGRFLACGVFLTVLSMAWGEVIRPGQAALAEKLLTEYNANLAPYFKGGLPVQVQIAPLQFPEISTTLETITMMAWFRHYWVDNRLTWNESEWGISSMTFTDAQVWQPDIIVYEMIEQEYYQPLLTVYPSGSVFISIPRKVQFGCSMHIVAFPFDTQRCNFTLGSWSANGLIIDVQPKEVDADELFYEYESAKPARSGIDMQQYQAVQEWALIAVRTMWKNEYYACCVEPYPVLKFEFEISRSRVTYLVGMVFPLVIVTFIGFFSLLMPSPVSGARPALSITILLTTATVYFVASRSTPLGNQTTVIGRLYIVSLAVSVLLVVLSIITTALNLVMPEDEEALKHFMFYFKMFDKDGCGMLTGEQARHALATLGLTEWEQDKLLKHFLKSKHDGVTAEQWRAIGSLTDKGDNRAIFHNTVIQKMVVSSIARNLKNSGRNVGGESSRIFMAGELESEIDMTERLYSDTPDDPPTAPIYGGGGVGGGDSELRSELLPLYSSLSSLRASRPVEAEGCGMQEETEQTIPFEYHSLRERSNGNGNKNGNGNSYGSQNHRDRKSVV